MKKKTSPPAFTDEQKLLYDHHIEMDEKTFSFTIKKHCVFVEEKTIFWELRRGKNSKNVCHTAEIYGMHGWRNYQTPQQEESIYSFFIFYNNKVWESRRLENTVKLIKSIIAKHELEEYEFNESQRKYRLKKKLAAQKTPSKIKVITKNKSAA